MNIQIVWDSIYDLTLQISDIKLDIAYKERELSESKLAIEIRELAKKKRELSNNIEERKGNIKESMLNSWLKSMEFEHQKVTLKKSPWSVKVLDENEIPETYKKEKITISLDKKKIKDGIVNWDIIPWAQIEYSYSLIITAK